MSTALSWQTLIRQYRPALEQRYGSRLLPSHHKALNAMLRCHTPDSGQSLLHCSNCDQHHWIAHGCGHRHCPLCQNNLATAWLERQRRKLIPVDYFLVTFTVPSQLRSLFWRKQRLCFDALMQCAAQTIASFARRAGAKGGDCGITAVLHTHSRRLDFHPHVHLIVPAGFIQRDKKRWVAAKRKYLFHHKNLAKVFRAKLLERLAKHNLELPAKTPTEWVVDCRHVGDGRPALEYLSRYLYRGVLSPKNIVENRHGKVSFRYIDANSNSEKTRCLDGADFLWLLLQHILPRGFQRVRNYGYLHHNNKALLATVQLRLKVQLPATVPLTKPALLCRECGCALKTQQIMHASPCKPVPQPHAPP